MSVHDEAEQKETVTSRVASGHPWHVHLSWPFSMLRSKMKLSSHEYKQQAANEFISKLERYHCPTFVIEKLERAAVEVPVRSKVAKPSSSLGLEFWLVLGWHPAWSPVNLNASLVHWSRPAGVICFRNSRIQCSGCQVQCMWQSRTCFPCSHLWLPAREVSTSEPVAALQPAAGDGALSCVSILCAKTWLDKNNEHTMFWGLSSAGLARFTADAFRLL
eukprot:5098343-Lingulodinium_polyedra.AAC.1